MKKTLKFWILTLVSVSMVAILCSSLFSGYLVTKDRLINNSLALNEMYATKLAQMTEEVFKLMQGSLAERKADVVINMENEAELTRILHDIRLNGSNFNSLSVINKDSMALATSPNVGIVGKKINSVGLNEALNKKENIVTSPYKADTGRLLILISTPLFDQYDNYIGSLNGTIYLQQDNFIKNILAKHYNEDDSYVYVVDKNGTIVYHPMPLRIGENVKENTVVKKLMQSKSGSDIIYNTEGEKLVAGYSYIPTSDWGVISQTPYDTSTKPMIGIMTNMFLYSLPFFAVFLLLASFVAKLLAKPLQKLALFTLDPQNDDIELEVSTAYFEAEQLTQTIANYYIRHEVAFEDIKLQSLTDPLTGLKNRRFSQLLFESLIEKNQSFSLIMIDIDHFKKINDEFGHNVGDEVLQFVADKMLTNTTKNDVCIRLGGEEFIVALPEKTLHEAFLTAEDLRIELENAYIPSILRSITLSLGVGEYHLNNEHIVEFMERVDQALYTAKKEGRNRTEISTFKSK